MLEMSRLLYSEAKKNVLMGRYPLSRDDCDRLAGIQAVIMKKEGSEITTETFRYVDSSPNYKLGYSGNSGKLQWHTGLTEQLKQK